jgi:hypothetical protein
MSGLGSKAQGMYLLLREVCFVGPLLRAAKLPIRPEEIEGLVFVCCAEDTL